MALRNLTLQAMVNLSEAWTDPKRDRKLLASIPLIEPLLPKLDEAHQGLIAKQKVPVSNKSQIADIQKEEAEIDAVHDRKMRGTFNALTGFADLADDPTDAAAYLDLRDRLFPTGLKAISRSYLEEAGDAKLLPGRLDDNAKKLMSKTPIPGGKIKDAVDAWLSAAVKLGQLEAKRAQMEEETASKNVGQGQSEIIKARNAWIKAAKALQSNLELAADAGPTLVKRIMGPLQAAETKADRRTGGARAFVETPQTIEPTGNQASRDGQSIPLVSKALRQS